MLAGITNAPGREPFYCPHCHSSELQVVKLWQDLRIITVLCVACNRHTVVIVSD